MKNRVITPILLGAILLAGARARAQSTYSNAVMSLGPAAYWPLAEVGTPSASGLYVATNLGTAQAAGNGYYETWWTNFSSGNSLTNVNNIVHAAGGLASDSDTSLQCGGTGQYLVFPRTTNGVANPAVALVPPFSIEMWVFIHSTNSLREILVEGGNQVEGGPAYTNAIGQEGIEMGINKTHFYWKTYNGPGGVSGGTSMAMPDSATFSNSWHHVVMTFDGTVKSFYDNGVLSKSSTLTSKNPEGQVYVPDMVSPMIIGDGNELSGRSSAPIDGSVDEFAIYPVVLSATTVANHYSAGTNVSPSPSYVQTVLNDSPTIYLRLDEPAFTGPALSSLPVANNYGTLGASANGLYQPGAAPGTTGPAYSGFGASSYGVALNGFNGGVDVGGGSLPASLNPTGTQPLTIMTWFRGNPADAGPRIQALVSHGTNSYRLGLDSVPGNYFNPGAGPQLGFANNAEMQSLGMDLNDGQWHFAAGVSDGTNDFLYLDGLLVKSGTSVANVPGNARDLILGGDPYFLGPMPTTAPAGFRGGLFYDGSIAHVAFFTNALTSAQIQQVFAAAGVPPVVHQQPAPANLAVAVGTNITYTTVVSGSSPISYQWYSTNGTALSGQTGSSLVFSNAVTGNSGSYYLVATNSYGAATSSVVTLTVFGPPVVLESMPSDIEVFGGSSPILNITALGSQPFAFQWTSNGVAISGATNSSYAVSTTASQLGVVTYIGTVTNIYGAASVTNVVTVLADPTAAYPLAVLADAPVAFFRLTELGGTTAYDYVGGYNAIYTNVFLGQDGYSSLEPTEKSMELGDFPPDNNFAGNAPSYLTFETNSGNAEFSVEAWVQQYFTRNNDGIVTLGYGNADQFILDTGATASGFLRFGVRNAANVSFLANSSVNLASDGQWHHVVGVCDQAGGHLYLYLDGVQIASGAITPGTGILPSTVPLSIGARESANNNPVDYDYQFIGKIDDVAIYNQALSATQVRNHFFASGAAPIITQLQPPSQSVNQGDNATFTVSAAGTPPLSYQWYDNSSTLIPWGTNATITLTNVQPAQAGSYSVHVNNPYGLATTNASLNVNTGIPVIAVDVQPTNSMAFVGAMDSFSVTVSGSEPLHYQWYLNNAAIGGANSQSYSFAALSGTNDYFVIVTNTSGSATSSVAAVIGVPVVTINPSNYTSNLKITFAGFNRPTGLTNFPALVRLSAAIPGFSYGQFASPVGADLQFTASTNLQALPYEIEQWNPGGESIVWVQVPQILGTNDYITAYWGNPAQTVPAASNTNGAVWKGPFSSKPEFDLVWHLNQTNFPFADSTLQFPALTGVAPSPGTGVAGAGVVYNGSTTFLDAGPVSLSNSYTLSVWVNVSPSIPNIGTVWASKPGSGTANGIAMNINNFNTTDGALRFITGNGSSSASTTSAGGSVTFGQWHLVTASIDTTLNKAHLYVDGNEVTLGANSTLSNYSRTNDVLLGIAADNFFDFDGTMDEARIEDGTRSIDWIWASWATVSTNSGFANYSAVSSTFTGPVVLQAQVTNGMLVLSWTSGTLQSATDVAGPYTDVTGASSPYAVAPTAARQFFRVRVQ